MQHKLIGMSEIKIRRAILRLSLSVRMILDDMPLLEGSGMYVKKTKFHGNLTLQSLRKDYGEEQIERLWPEGERPVLDFWQSSDEITNFLASLEMEEFYLFAQAIKDGRKKGTLQLEGVTFNVPRTEGNDEQEVREDILLKDGIREVS